MHRSTWLVAALPLAALWLSACEEKKLGPPATIHMHTFYEDADQSAGTLIGRVWDQESRALKVDGAELHYTVYEGHPDDGKVRCSLRAKVNQSDFADLPGEEGLGFSVHLGFSEACKALPEGEQTYGLIDLELEDGRVLRDTEYSWVPKGLGGLGVMNFPSHHADTIKRQEHQDDEKHQVKALVDTLEQLSQLRPTNAPPVDTPCPALPKATARVIRANRSDLHWLAKAYGQPSPRSVPEHLPGTGTFDGTNDQNVKDLAQHYLEPTKQTRPLYEARLARKLELVELVVPERLEGPKIASPGSRERSGIFVPGMLIGELWIVDARSFKILCRSKIATTDLQSAQGDQFATSYDVLNRQFAGALSQEINRASSRIAPGLRGSRP